MKIKFHGVTNLWVNNKKQVMRKYHTLELFTLTYLEKYDGSAMINFVLLNFSFIWIINEVVKVHVPIDDN